MGLSPKKNDFIGVSNHIHNYGLLDNMVKI